MNIRNFYRRSGVFLLSLFLGLAVHAVSAAEAVLSGPSQAVAGDSVVLHGKHFTAGNTFTVSIRRGDQLSEELVTADGNGSLQYQLHTAGPGKYQLQVRDSNNKVVASTMVTVHATGG